MMGHGAVSACLPWSVKFSGRLSPTSCKVPWGPRPERGRAQMLALAVSKRSQSEFSFPASTFRKGAGLRRHKCALAASAP